MTGSLQTFHYGDDSDEDWAASISKATKRKACKMLLQTFRSGELHTLVKNAQLAVLLPRPPSSPIADPAAPVALAAADKIGSPKSCSIRR